MFYIYFFDKVIKIPSQQEHHGQMTSKQRYINVDNVVSTSFDHDVPTGLGFSISDFHITLVISHGFNLPVSLLINNDSKFYFCL